MAVLDPFGLEPGRRTGRIAPTGWQPPEGAFVFSLGHDSPGVKRKFNVGDRVEVYQTADFGAAKLVRLRAKVRAPRVITAGAFWAFSVLVDDIERYRLTIKDTRERDLSDVAVSVGGLVGLHKLAFRLTLVST